MRMFVKDKKGIALISCYFVIVILAILGSAFLTRSISEKRIAEIEKDSIRAFNIAEGGLERAVHDLKRDFECSEHIPGGPSWRDDKIYTSATDPTVYIDLSRAGVQAIPQYYPRFYPLPYGTVHCSPLVSALLGGGSFTVELANVPGEDDEIWVKSTGTFGGLSRTVQACIRIEKEDWLSMIPGAVYSNGKVKLQFEEERDDAYIDGWDDKDAGIGVAGIYSSGKTEEGKKKIEIEEGEGRIDGNPPIKEELTEGELNDLLIYQYGLWDAFDCDALRARAIADGTYFQGDDYNTAKAKYFLPVVEGETNGVFFFDTRGAVPLNDAVLVKKTEANIELNGTCGNQMSGVIVVAGDLTIKDTKDCDFLFDGVILVLNKLTIDDKGVNYSNIVIKGAVLSDNIIPEEEKKPKKKPKKPKKPKEKRTKESIVDIKNATIKYDIDAIISATPWNIIREGWQEI